MGEGRDGRGRRGPIAYHTLFYMKMTSIGSPMYLTDLHNVMFKEFSTNKKTHHNVGDFYLSLYTFSH